MKRYLKGATSDGLQDEEMLAIMDPIEKDIQKRCKDRGKDEYVDDVRWGLYGFRIPIYKNPYPDKPDFVAEIAAFSFHYNPDDEDYSAEEQAHVQYDEFLQEWDYDENDEGEDYTNEDFITDAIEDEVYEAWNMNKQGQLTENDVISFVKTRLTGRNYNLIFNEDFTVDGIREAMKDYFWD